VSLGMVSTRSQAESYIKLGDVSIKGRVITKPGHMVAEEDSRGVKLSSKEQFVGRAGLKLASVAEAMDLDFTQKTVLDVGSSTGGFTEFALRNGAKKVIAIERGSDQLHPTLKDNPKIELHEKTDIRDFRTKELIDIVLIDVSFISLREILPCVLKLINKKTMVVAMVKPQFEAALSSTKHKGVIKNDKMRRSILKDFENWSRKDFVLHGQADSKVSGAKGNLERFYLLKKA
jgi:23S rRNA (cytidine1920-2'-O)/16S rRNA (cytidine1409-2'-O)-methyltransferase